MDDVERLLRSLQLDEYVELFARERIDSRAIHHLTDEDLKELGLPKGPRVRLLAAIRELRAPLQPAELHARERISKDHSADPEHAERRQLTVLFCDLVGYTDLASRLDPEVLQGIVRRYEDTCMAAITRYEGYVFQRLGDGIVAFFGYPLAHEGEAERAIRAGLEIIEAIATLDLPHAGRLQVRIGIATGVVVVSSAEKGAVGETMNLAARLQAIARPGNIVVSERVRRLAGGAFDYEDLGEQALKGIAQPTAAYRIVGVSQAASRFDAAAGESLTPLVGREQELALLLARWQLAQEGEGQVVLLSGEPGIGKSRISRALRERLEGQGAQALRFQCSPYHLNSALWPSIDNLERSLQFARDESPESRLDKLEALLVRAYGRPKGDVRFIAALLSIPCEQRYGPISMTPQRFKDETLRSLVDLIEAAARRQRSVLQFEDVHWTDPTTLEVLDLLIDRVRRFPLLIVLTHRPEFASRWGSHGHVTALNLSKLTRAQSSAMIAKIAGGKALPAELHEQILTKTDGVPLYVEELTKSILESGELKETTERYEYAGSAHSISVPATLRDSLMARLDRYAPVKEIAQIGAAIGREFSYELLAALAPMRQAQLDAALAQLTESGLAFRRGTPPEATYTFKHALVQDAAYDSLLKSRRQALHARIATVIEERFPSIKDTEPEVLAHHYRLAGRPEAAVGYWLRAGQRAMARVALAEAAAHLQAALEANEVLPACAERDRQELEIRVLLGTVHQSSLGWAAVEVIRVMEPARELARRLGDRERHLQIMDAFQAHHLNRCDFARVLEINAEIDRLADESADSRALVVAAIDHALTRSVMGDFLGARQACDLTLRLYDPVQHRTLVHTHYNFDPKCLALASAAYWLWALGYPDQARQAALDGLDWARQLDHPFNLCFFGLCIGSQGLILRGETHLALQWLAQARDIAHEHAITYVAEGTVPIWEGKILVELGRYAEAYDKMTAAQEPYESAGGRLGVPDLCMTRARASIGLGQFERARALLEKAVAMIDLTGHRMDEAEVHRTFGELWRAQPSARSDAAEAAFQRALSVARAQAARSLELRAATSLARLWQSQGRREDARALLQPVYEWFTEGLDTKDLIAARALLKDLETAR